MTDNLPERLQEIVDDFGFLTGQEKLEYLLQLAGQLPPLPDRLLEQRESMDQVHECMTPVFILAERENGRVNYYFDVPEESPTVRGFAAILQEGLRDASPAEIQAIPLDFYREMGLHQVLSPQRLNGISAILAHMQRLAES